MKKNWFMYVLCSLLLFFVACPNGKTEQKQGFLTKITIDGKNPIGGIKENMIFGSTSEVKVKVVVETSPTNSVVTYTPDLKNGFWDLEANKENELMISVKSSSDAKANVYKAKIIHDEGSNFGKLVNKDIVDYLLISGMKINEQEQEVDRFTIEDEIFKGEDVTIELKGPIATIRVGHSEKKLKGVKLNSQDMKEEPVPNVASQYVLDVALQKSANTIIKIEAEAEDGNKTEVIFKIKRIEGEVDIPGIRMLIEDDVVIEDSLPLSPFVLGDADGKHPQLDGIEPTNLEIGVVGKEILEGIEIEGKRETLSTKTINGNTFYYIEKQISGVAPKGKDIEIKLIPKDKETYGETTLKFNLFYKPEEKNADFAAEGSSPLYEEEITWNNQDDNLADDYGAKSVNISLFTKVKTTKVFYQKMCILEDKDAEGNDIIKVSKPLSTPQELTYSYDGTAQDKRKKFRHSIKNIQLYEDKPTMLKFYTVAQDGTKDDAKGVKYLAYNPIELRWDYDKKEKGASFLEPAYDEIEIKKAMVKDKKIFVAFKIWDEMSGYKIDQTKIKTPHQKMFEKLTDDEAVSVWMCSEIDVSTLVDDNVQELEVALPVLKKVGETNEFKPCFTYSVKIKLSN